MEIQVEVHKVLADTALEQVAVAQAELVAQLEVVTMEALQIHSGVAVMEQMVC
jgi:hypothetical protein